MKKVATIMAGVLALATFAPLASASAVNTTNGSAQFTIDKGQQEREPEQISFDSETFNAITDIEKFLNTDNGIYELDAEARTVVGDGIYNKYLDAIEELNAGIKEGQYELKNGELVVNSNYSVYAPNIYGNWYWWGYAVTLSDAETKQQVRVLKDTQSISAFVLAIVAAVPGLQGTALPSALVQGGLALLIYNLESNNKGRGVTLNLHVGYYNVTSN